MTLDSGGGGGGGALPFRLIIPLALLFLLVSLCFIINVQNTFPATYVLHELLIEI